MAHCPPPPIDLDGYRFVRLLGRGGMGEVYLAHDHLLDRPVAIKLIATARADVESRKRFLLEARAIARLQHPNVVSIYRVGMRGAVPFLVSEYVPGKPLSLVEKPMPAQQVLDIGLKLARALAAAHQRGVIHRDIKPANVMLAEDAEPKLLDFGIAKLVESHGGSPPPTPLTLVPSLVPPWDHPPCSAPSSPCLASDEETQDLPVDIAPVFSPSQRPLTAAGTIVGTLLYMAPEVLHGRPASFASDVYSFGAMLYELCSGHLPFTSAEIRAAQRGEPWPLLTPLSAAGVGIDPRLAAVIERCLAPDPAKRFSDGNDLRSALAQLTPEARGDILPGGNPYRGLRSFEQDHRALFFGRDSEIRTVLDRLASDPLVLVAGDSGVGKSSLCRAGVLPRVGDWLDHKRSWSSVQLVPSAHPLDALIHALGTAVDETTCMQMQQQADEDPSVIARLLRAALGQERGLVILVDQLEELATISDPEQASTTAEALGWLCDSAAPIRVLATARSDFLGRIASLPLLGDLAVRSLYFLRPLSEPRIREAIVGPAHALGVPFESDEMVDGLVHWTVNSCGGLPLLQFALAELWDTRAAAEPAIAAKHLASLGGVAGALSRHADQVLASMTADERSSARSILLRLVTPGRTRARRHESQLLDNDMHAPRALAALVRGRLVVASDSSDGTTYELAHEAMIRGWATLAQWLAESEEGRLARERLAAAASEWDRLGRGRDGLWSRSQLAGLGDFGGQPISERESSFLRACRSAALRARLKRITAIAAIPVLVGSTWAGVVMRARAATLQKIESLETDALSEVDSIRRLRADAQESRNRAFLAFDSQDPIRGEQLWARALETSARTEPLLADAARSAEHAWMLDPSHPRSRKLLAVVLGERAAAAEDRRDRAMLSEVLDRMAFVDTDGELRKAWLAPGVVRFAITPAEADITIRLANGSAVRRAPGAPPEFELPSGSYSAEVSAYGRATLQVPFLLGRSETLVLQLHLLAPSDIPAGFVLVPAGRFLFGSNADESLRSSYFHAPPLHAATTSAFLIARHETTWAEWIAYLESLPAPERLRRTPQVGKGGFHGALELRSDSRTGWRLSFQPAEVPYSAARGEPVLYRGRGAAARQDWARLPVTGISADDAVAYARWLTTTGRVPRARLCTEKEWEHAARGADGREFPTGNELKETDANIDSTYAKSPEAMGPDEVGSHPGGRSPFGVDDLAGNAWEWTLSSVEASGHVARGGSYYYDANAARSSNREVLDSSFRDTTVGLRICADPPDAESARRAALAR